MGAKLSAASGEAVVRRVEGDFDDYRDLLLEEIMNRGIVLTFHAHVSNMLARTAAATGARKTVYRNAEIVGFCKADVSHDMLAADPDNIIYCPQSIMIYELENAPGIILIAYRKASAASKTDELLADIIKEVLA